MMKRLVSLLAGCVALYSCSTTNSAGPAPGNAAQSVLKTAAAATPTIDDCVTNLGAVGSGEYEVVITFSGIQMFDRETAGVVNVRMPNAIGGRAEIPDAAHPSTPLRHAIPPHISYILGSSDTMKLIDTDLAQPAYYEGSCYQYYRMNGDHVTVAEASAPKGINQSIVCTSDAVTANEYCPNDGSTGGLKTKGSMHWLPSASTILGGAKKGKADHFVDVPDPAVIAGVVRVDRGYLETVVTNPNVWAFQANSADSEHNAQAMAQEVRWHMRGKGTPFILQVERKSGKKFDLQFMPVNNKVELFIANSPVDETGPIRTSMATSPDHHFPLYYEFVDGFSVADGPIPFTSKSRKCDASVQAEKPTLKRCANCPDDPYCKASAAMPPGWKAMPLPSGLNCGGQQWP